MTTNFAKEQLKSLIERIERLEEEKKGLSADIKDVFQEAKSNGFDTAVMRQVLRLRRKDLAQRQEEEAILDLYLHALGMQPELPFDVGVTVARLATIVGGNDQEAAQ